MTDARDPREQAAPPLPERFELRELIGRGAMADVYAAHDRMLDRPVAVKVFRVDPDVVTRRRFQDEARALARLSHPGLVAVYDVDTKDARPYLVMRLVHGQSLQNLLLTGPLPADEVFRIGAILAGALAHVHANGVVHRDVKPSNILLDADGSPLLGDFGIALLTGAERLTRTNEIIGTPAYLAPEQVLGGEVGPPVDVYALGLVLLECLTGEIEYFGGSEVEIALARLHRAPRIPSDLPFDLAGMIAAMTAQNPSERPSAAAVARHLSGSTEVMPVPIGSATSRLAAPVPVAAARRSAVWGVWRPVAVALAAAAALATGLTLLLGSPNPTSGPQRNPGVAEQPVTTPSPTTTTTTAPPTTTEQSPSVVARRHGGPGNGDGRGPGGPDDHGGGGDGGGHGSSGGSGGGSGGGGGN
ncbi:MAG TPA: serine/threonine-protein kinase [Pseudonocardiaceae bacterium]|nr:serine/threonine-protein kinase [Pseudonocardiaceae bacterium]